MPTTGYPRRWWTLVILCLSLLIISLDNTILNVALPTLVRDLDATNSELQWIVDSYILVFAGLLLTAGALGDHFGRKIALFTGYVIFAAGSLLAAWAGTPNHLIAIRALMGAGGAFIMPATLSILINVFPREERARAIAIWSGVSGLGVPLGPVLGGWLLEHYWWGSIFLINVPIILIALIAGIVLVPESKAPEASTIDPVGAVLSMAGLATLLYAIIEAPQSSWTSTSTLLWGGVGVGLLALFTIWEMRRERPMLDISLFKNPRFTGASVAVTLVFFALVGALFFLTQYLQFVLGYTTLQTGIRMVPVALGLVTGTIVSTRLTTLFGTKIVVAGALAISASGFGILSFMSDTSGYTLVLIALIVTGFGMGAAMAPATDSIMGAVPQANAGVGSAVNDTTRQVGGALGVAILGSLLSTTYASNVTSATQGLPTNLAAMARDSIGPALEVAQQLGGAQGQALAQAARSAFIDAMGTTLLIGGGFALAGAIVALLFLPARETEVLPDAERNTEHGDGQLQRGAVLGD